MGSVQLNADGAGGQKAQRSFTFSTSNLSVYCRVKFPTLLSTWAVAWLVSSGSNDVGPFLNGGASSVQWDNNSAGTDIFTGASASLWYDFAILKNGTNVDIYWKLSTDSTWTLVTLAASTFTPTLFTLGDFPPSSSLANRPVRYGKVVVWKTLRSAAEVKGEAAYRELLAHYDVWYYDPCLNAASFGTDQSAAKNNLTITGSPASNADDPGFPAYPLGPIAGAPAGWFDLDLRNENWFAQGTALTSWFDDEQALFGSSTARAGWFDPELVPKSWFDEELVPDPTASIGWFDEDFVDFPPPTALGAYPFDFDPVVRRFAPFRRRLQDDPPLDAIITSLGAFPIEEPQAVGRRVPRALVLRSEPDPLLSLAPAFGAQPADEVPAVVRPRRPVVPVPPEPPWAGVLGIVPEHQAPPPRRRPAPQRSVDEPPPSLFLFSPWVSEEVPARTTRRAAPLRVEDGQLPSLFVFAPWVPEESPRRAPAARVAARAPWDGLVLPPLAAVLGQLVEDQVARVRQPARYPVRLEDRPLAALVAATVGSWFEDLPPPVRAVRQLPRPSAWQESLIAFVPLRPWLEDVAPLRARPRTPNLVNRDERPLSGLAAVLGQWFDDQARTPVPRRALPAMAAPETPLSGLLRAWLPDEIASYRAPAPRRTSAPEQGHLLRLGSTWLPEELVPGPLRSRSRRVRTEEGFTRPLPAPALLTWFDDASARVFARRRLVVLPHEVAPLVALVAIYIPAPSDRTATLRAHHRDAALRSHARDGALRSHKRKGKLR